MTDFKSYIQYFQLLAATHVDIKGFFVMDINETLEALRGDIKFPCLILTNLTGNYQATSIDNIIDQVKGGFIIIDRLDDPDSFVTEMNILNATKEIGKDIIARMIRDLYDKGTQDAINAIQGFNVGSVSYQMLDGIFDNCYGFNFNFQLDSFSGICYNRDKWQPLPDGYVGKY